MIDKPFDLTDMIKAIAEETAREASDDAAVQARLDAIAAREKDLEEKLAMIRTPENDAQMAPLVASIMELVMALKQPEDEKEDEKPCREVIRVQSAPRDEFGRIDFTKVVFVKTREEDV